MNKKMLTKTYYDGVREGIKQYAHWKDGVQYVGTCGTTLNTAIERINAEETRAVELLEDRRQVKSELGFSRIGLKNI